MNKQVSNSDIKKLDAFFSGEDSLSHPAKKKELSKHTKAVRLAKLLLPAISAGLIGLLILYPKLHQSSKDYAFDIKMPKTGDLEKLHMENTIFYITDKDNQVHNFTATDIDETEAGSKLVKINHPEGILPLNQTTWFNIKSPTGYYDQNANTLKLTDDVKMFYSDGMNMDVPYITYDFNTKHGYSDQPLIATGEMGDLNSEGFEFFSDQSVLIFLGKTHIIINEENLKGTSRP